MKKGTVVTIVLIIVLLAGLSLLLYPSVADLINKQHQTVAIASYVDNIINTDKSDLEKIRKEADTYNKSLLSRKNEYTLSDEQRNKYRELLYIKGSDIMGYVDIPTIDMTLPIYHGSDDSVLRVGVGHLEWTSLPVGGENTHCVLVGHRGLPSAKLFTDLDQLELGDVFMLHILDDVLTYEVDQILIVKPDETEPLKIVEGGDFCTLLTCTPYGINTHRILVRGKRIDTKYESSKSHITSEAVQIEPLIIAPIAAIPLLLLLIVIFIVLDRRRTRGE